PKHVAAAREALLRPFRQAATDGDAVAGRQRRDVWRRRQVLHNELLNAAAREWPLARQQFLVDDGQAVLIAKAADDAVERLRRGVHRRDAARDRGGLPLQRLDQAEVRNLDVIVNQEQVLRFDVEVLKFVFPVHQIENFGG